MSQSGTQKVNTGGNPTVETVTGNSGGPVGPDASHNLNLLGNNSTGINIVGNPATNTLTVTSFQSTTSQEGTVTLATDAQAIAGSNTANALTSSNLAAKLGTQTAHSLAVFEGTSSAITALGVAGNGFLPIGSIGADPVLAPLTAGPGININNTPGAITISFNGGSAAVATLTGNSGGAINPVAGNINTLGTGSITIAGAGNTLTTELTGLTNHAIQIGAGTATLTQLGAGSTGQILQTNTTADPTWSTATYPSTATSTGTILRADGTNWVATTATYPATTTINQLLYSSSANVIAGLSTANQGVLTTGATGIPVITALATNGQLIIGSTAGVPAAATLTPGVGIAITNGSNSITIEATGAGFAWSDQSGAFAAVKENGYFITATSTATLPSAPTEGDTIAFIVDTTQILTIQANTGQLIRVGTTVSAAAGTCVSNFRGDSIELVYRSTGTTWFSLGAPEGTWTIT